MEFTRRAASMVMPALLVCAVYGCSSTGEVSGQADGGSTEVASAGATSKEAGITPEEFVAGQNLDGDDGADPANDVVCRRVKPVGSHFSKTVCTSRAEKKKMAEEGRDFMKSMPPAFAKPPPQ